MGAAVSPLLYPGAIASRVAGVADLRSVRLQDQLLEKWKSEMRHKSPAEREHWLGTQEGIIALGAKECSRLLKAIRKLKTFYIDHVCSGSWLEAWENDTGTLPIYCNDEGNPIPRVNRDGMLVPLFSIWPRRRHASRMVLSRVRTAFGCDHGRQSAPVTDEDGRLWSQPSYRYTPAIAVAEEDFIDGLSENEAEFYPHPPSVTAMQIAAICAEKMHPQDGRW